MTSATLYELAAAPFRPLSTAARIPPYLIVAVAALSAYVAAPSVAELLQRNPVPTAAEATRPSTSSRASYALSLPPAVRSVETPVATIVVPVAPAPLREVAVTSAVVPVPIQRAEHFAPRASLARSHSFAPVMPFGPRLGGFRGFGELRGFGLFGGHFPIAHAFRGFGRF